MTDKLVVSWKINSLFQHMQRIYRKVDEEPETLLESIGPAESAYLDDSIPETATTNVTYRVESVATFRGIEITESSEPISYSLVPEMEAQRFTVGEGEAQIYMGNAFQLKNLDDNNLTESISMGDDLPGYYKAQVPTGQYDVIIEDMTQPLDGVVLMGGITSLDQWHEAGYSPTFVMGVSPTYLMFSGATTLQKVPETLHPSIKSTANMFDRCSNFNDPSVVNWDTSNVTDMSVMFSSASAFDQPIGNWNVANVTVFQGMFLGAENFNQPLDNWDVSNAVNMQAMFRSAVKFNQPLEGWNTVNVTNFYGMFEGAAAFNGAVSNWNTSNAIDMRDMFRSASAFDQDISAWDTSKVQNMSYMFYNANHFNQPIGKWNVSSVSDFSRMFAYATAFSQKLTKWCVSSQQYKPTDFDTSSGLIASQLPVWGTCPDPNYVPEPMIIRKDDSDIAAIDTKTELKITQIEGTGATIEISPESMDLGEGSRRYTIAGATGKFTIEPVDPDADIEGLILHGSFDAVEQWYGGEYIPVTMGNYLVQVIMPESTVKEVPDYLPKTITRTTAMFLGAYQFNDPKIANWDVSHVVDMGSMFAYAADFNQDISSWNVTHLPGRPTDFAANSPLTPEHEPKWYVPPVKTMEILTRVGILNIYGIKSGDTYTHPDGTTVTATSASMQVNSQAGVGVLTLNSTQVYELVRISSTAVHEVYNFPTITNVKRVSFQDCTELVKAPAVLPKTLTTTSEMFRNAEKFNDTGIVDWDVSHVTDMSGMFNTARVFNQDLSGWDVSNVTTMNEMFTYAESFNQPLDAWKVSKVTSMRWMFKDTLKFNQPLGSWDVSNVTNMDSMFNGAIAFNQDLSQWCVPLFSGLPNSFATNSALIADNFPVWGTCPRGEIYGDDYSTYVLRQGYFISNPGAKLTLGNGEVVEIPNDNLGYLVKDNQVGNASLVGNNAEYVARGSALVKVLTYPKNATSINHQLSTNLIEVPDTLPSKVTSLKFAFDRCASFNHPNIGKWDTSNVTDMSNMFYNCSAFNQPLNTWNTSKVTDMSYMFRSCSAFNQPLDTWDVGNVTNMSNMFNSAFRFSQPLNNWNVSNVTIMTSMFHWVSDFNYPLNNWNVSNVTDMYGMFTGCQVFDQPLNNWNVSKVINMNSMFDLCNAFGQDLSQWCVPLITKPPTGFNNSAPNLTEDKHPVWGTCPRGEV